jgi:drug/metabolite transporter (DMT)-like permease
MPASQSLAVVYGLCSAIAWGAGDFSGGLATRRLSVLLVVLWSQFIGAGTLIALALTFRETLPQLRFMIYGGLGGVVGVFGLVALYRGLAFGRMGIVAPLSALTAAVIPVVIGAFQEGLPTVIQLAGFALAVLAIWTLSYTRKEGKPQFQEWTHALAAGVGFGLFFVFIDRASGQGVLWPLVAARAASIFFMLCLVLLRRDFAAPSASHLTLLVLVGICDAAGNAFFALASRIGRLDISAVLASLYPAATVLLAWVLLRERMLPRQWAGVALATAALVMISW